MVVKNVYRWVLMGTFAFMFDVWHKHTTKQFKATKHPI